jgi:hypothetical protein
VIEEGKIVKTRRESISENGFPPFGSQVREERMLDFGGPHCIPLSLGKKSWEGN